MSNFTVPWMHALMVPVLLSAALYMGPARATNCAVAAVQRQTLLDLPFKQFDQQAGSGWRPLYARKCYIEAASLLKAYVKEHPTIARKQYMLAFHTGQMFALAGEYPKAIHWMEKGYSNRKSDLIDWNAFVNANIAFLKHDYAALLRQRSLINQEPAMPDQPLVPSWAVGKKMNLDVVDGFIACFAKPYELAYGDSCRRQGTTLANHSLQRTR